MITDQPDDQLIIGGTAANLSVAASGLPTPTYQWQVFTSSWNDVGGEMSPLFAPTVAEQTQYRCVVINAAGSVTSNVATISVGTVPVISDEADAASVPIGGTATFLVVASGSPAPTYQWQRSTTIGGPTFAAITNATGSSYSFGPVALTDSGFLYRCVVTNALGSDTSAEPALTVTAIAPTFVQQPQDRSVIAGSTATFSVVVSGNPLPTLQWERSDDAGANWSVISLASGTSFTTQVTTMIDDNGDQYRCVATNSGGSPVSSAAILTVAAAATAPIVTPVSSPVSVPAGQLAILSVTITGSPTPTLQWRRNGVIIGGAVGSSLSFTAALADSGATYTCTASNSAGSAQSVPIALTVTPVLPTVAYSAPSSADVGVAYSLNATVTGLPAPTIQWSVEGTNVAGATSATFVWTPLAVDAGQTRTVTCTVINTAGSATSATGIPVAGQAPAFTQHPANVSAATNGWSTFTVLATGTPTPSLQWQTSTNAGTTWTPVSGGTAASVTVQAPGTVPGTVPGIMPQYRCVATNGVGAGTATSTVATLTVTATSLTITTQPVDLALADAAGGSFTVVASSDGALTYQWQRRLYGETTWSVVGATASSLPVTADLTVNQGAGYRCIVTAGGVSVATRVALLSITSAPQFILHPVAHTAAIGEVATFTAKAVGGPQPTLTWERSPNGSTGWVTIPGATGNYLAFTVKATDIGMYVRCAASSSFGGGGGTIIYGLAVPLNVTTVSPSFTTQPVGSTIALGGQALLAVAVTGSPTPTVQWQTSTNGVDFADVASAGTALTYTTPVAGAAVSTVYRCLATNAAGTVASDAALVQVQIIAPYLIQQPVSVATVPTATATFAVVAGGSATLTYQWQKNEGGVLPFVDVTGAIAANYTTAATSIVADNGDQYRCVITNGAGSTASDVATLLVQVAPVAPAFSTHPSASSAVAGQPVSFSVVATGVPTPTLQWRKNGAVISGATFQTVFIDAADYADNTAEITCVATSSAGTATSNVAVLTVTPIAPSITTQPMGVNVGAGSELSLSVVAIGTAPLTYQWQRNGTAVAIATTATYVIPRCSTSAAGMWTCVVTGPGGSVTSQGAQVAVVPVFFPVLTDLLDLDASPPEVVKPTPAAWGLADGELLKWVASTSAYTPVNASEELMVGGSYFLDQGERSALLPRYAPAPAPTIPPALDLEPGAWNPASVVVADQINVDGTVLTFNQLAGIDPLPVGFTDPLPTVWVVDPATGAMQMIGDPSDVFGATATAPAGSTLWIDTGAPSSTPAGLRAPPMPKASG